MAEDNNEVGVIDESVVRTSVLGGESATGGLASANSVQPMHTSFLALLRSMTV